MLDTVNFIRCCLCIMFMVLVVHIQAQVKHTVLINNKPTNTLDLLFKNPLDTNMVRLTDVKLCMGIYENKLINISNNLKFSLLSGATSTTQLGTMRLESTNIGNALCKLNHKAIFSGGVTQISMTGKFTEKIQNVTFYGSDPFAALFHLNKSPRLLLQYNIKKSPYGEEWSQLHGNAQHNRRSDWRSASSSTNKDISELRKVQKSGSGIQYISAYKGKLIIIKEGSMSMLSNAHDNAPIWSLSLPKQPDKQPVITKEGLMIFVSRQKTIEVFDLNKGVALKSVLFTECKWKIDQKTEIVLSAVNSEITLGYDGTLYMAFSSQNSPAGIVALTAYPDLTPRWIYNTIHQVGQVSLSADERLVFGIENSGEKSKVIAIENINGQLAGESDLILGSYKNDQMKYIPALTLQNNQDTTVVYALDGNTMSNRLLVFKTHYSALVDANGNIKKDKTPSLTLYQEIKSASTTSNTGLSHPTVTLPIEVLMYKDNKIVRYNYIKNTFADVSSVREDLKAHDLSILTQQIKGHFYVISDHKILLKKTKDDADFGYSDITNSSAIKSTVLNADMSLFVLGNDGAVVHYYPIAANDKLNLTQDMVQSRTTYMAQNVSIGSVQFNSDFQGIITAEQKIGIGKGFRVKKGAEVTFQINK